MTEQEKWQDFQEITQDPNAVKDAALGADVIGAYGEEPDAQQIAVTSLYETIKDIATSSDDK